jgi:hypothetical protein
MQAMQVVAILTIFLLPTFAYRFGEMRTILFFSIVLTAKPNRHAEQFLLIYQSPFVTILAAGNAGCFPLSVAPRNAQHSKIDVDYKLGANCVGNIYIIFLSHLGDHYYFAHQ